MQIKHIMPYSKISKALKPIKEQFHKELHCKKVKLFKSKNNKTLAVLGYGTSGKLKYSAVIKKDGSMLQKAYSWSYIFSLPQKVEKVITTLLMSPKDDEVYKTIIKTVRNYENKELWEKIQNTKIKDITTYTKLDFLKKTKARNINKNGNILFDEFTTLKNESTQKAIADSFRNPT